MRVIDTAVSPSADTSWPSLMYEPSVFSRIVIRLTPLSKRERVFGNEVAGRTLA